MNKERQAKVNEINRLRTLIKESETQRTKLESLVKEELINENTFRLNEVISGVDRFNRKKTIIIEHFECTIPTTSEEPYLMACGHSATKITGRNEYLKNWSSSYFKIKLDNKVKRKAMYIN